MGGRPLGVMDCPPVISLQPRSTRQGGREPSLWRAGRLKRTDQRIYEMAGIRTLARWVLSTRSSTHWVYALQSVLLQ